MSPQTAITLAIFLSRRDQLNGLADLLESTALYDRGQHAAFLRKLARELPEEVPLGHGREEKGLEMNGCICCGETIPEFLGLDSVGHVLCHNCNFALSNYRKCPHGNLLGTSYVNLPETDSRLRGINP